MLLYGQNPRALAYTRTNDAVMLYLTCTMISSVDLAQYGVTRAKDWLSVACGTCSSYSVRIFTSIQVQLAE